MNGKHKKRDYKTILAVVAISFVLWFMVKMSQIYEYAYEVPLEIVNTNSQSCLKYPVPQKVKVVFSGKGENLFRVQFSELSYQVDLSDVRQRMVLRLVDHPEYVQLPAGAGVSVKSILRPQEVVFELESCHEKEVPVKPNYRVTTDLGFILVGVQARPETVLVKGAQSYVDTLKMVTTSLVERKKANLPFKESVAVQGNPTYWANYLPSQVELFFDIQRIAEREIKGVAVKVINVPSQLNVVPLPSFVTLYIKGGEKILANARPEDFEVIIDFRRDYRGEGVKIPASIQTQLNLLYAESRPSTFELVVKPKTVQ